MVDVIDVTVSNCVEVKHFLEFYMHFTCIYYVFTDNNH